MITSDIDKRSQSRYVYALSAVALAAALWLGGCGNDGTGTIVGSGHLVSKTTPTMVVEKISIWIPFNAVVHDGDARKIVIKGEDNLLSEITVSEVAVSKWRISAPASLKFEQHSDLQISIPFIDMVSVDYDGAIKFADKPFVARRTPASDEDAGSP